MAKTIFDCPYMQLVVKLNLLFLMAVSTPTKTYILLIRISAAIKNPTIAITSKNPGIQNINLLFVFIFYSVSCIGHGT